MYIYLINFNILGAIRSTLFASEIPVLALHAAFPGTVAQDFVGPFFGLHVEVFWTRKGTSTNFQILMLLLRF